MIKPEFYTDHEGGDWIPWPDNRGINLTAEELSLRSPTTVEIDGTTVHSFALTDPYAPLFVRWDCINGLHITH